MLLIAYLMAVILGFLIQKSKLLASYQLLIIFIIVGLNTGGMDFNIYEILFDIYRGKNSVIIENEFIYYNLMGFFGDLDYDFIFFNAIMTFLIVIIMFYFINKYAKRKSLALSLFLIYPFFDMAIQKRNFLAFAIFLLAIDVILEHKKNWKFKYIIFTLIASMIHSSFLIYLFVLIIIDLNKSRQLKVISTIIVGEILLLPILPQLIGPFFSNQKIDLYFYNSTSNISLSTSIGYILIHLFLYLIFNQFFISTKNDSRLYSVANIFNNFCLIVMPLYLYGSNFIRIYRNLFLFLFIATTTELIITNNNKIRVKPLTITLIQICFLIIINLFFYFIGGNIPYTETIVPLFTNNVIVN